MTSTESSSTSAPPVAGVPETGAARVQQFMADFLAVAEPLQLWATVRIRDGLRHRIDPEDLVQETCIRAYTNYSRFDPHQGSFRAWVFGIATKVLLQQLRALRQQGGGRPRHGTGAAGGERGGGERGGAVPGDIRAPEMDALLDSVSSITSKVARREAVAAVLDEIGGLCRQDRWLLLYRGLERLEFTEIGTRLGLHPEAARARWRRLLDRLRQRPRLRRFLD